MILVDTHVVVWLGFDGDRIIGATALVEGLSLLTADRGIRRSRALQTIW